MVRLASMPGASRTMTLRPSSRIGSPDRWLYTHRGGKWATYYSPEALAFQARFFDCFLEGEDNGMRALPRVRLAVHERRAHPVAVRQEAT